jgi:4-amino-4-deoxy-L-arabinose transferase-like glycosyltransferase
MFNNGAAGLLRLFNGTLGGQASWLLPLALIGLLTAGSRRLRLPLDRRQQAVLLWGTWLLTVGAFFSVAGFFHSYYLITLAPAVAALAAIGLGTLCRDFLAPRGAAWRAWLLPAALALTAAGQVYILGNFPAWRAWITPPLAGLTLLAAGALVVLRLRRKLQPIVWKAALTAGLLALLIAPTAWTIDTVAASNGGQIPSAGPSATTAGGFSGGSPGSGPNFGAGNGAGPGGFSAQTGITTTTTALTTTVPSGAGAMGATGAISATAGSAGAGTTVTTTLRARFAGGAMMGGPGGNGGGSGGSSVDQALLQYLEKHQGTTKYLVAVSNSMSAAPYIIQTGKPVMSLGGFSGSDPILTTAQLKALIENNTVRYFLLGGGAGGGQGSSSVTSWVQSACTAVASSAWQGSTGSGSTATTATSGGGGGAGQQLYDCSNVATSRS